MKGKTARDKHERRRMILVRKRPVGKKVGKEQADGHTGEQVSIRQIIITARTCGRWV